MWSLRPLAIILFALLAAPIGAEYFEECDGYEAGTFLASTLECNKFIYCDDEESQEGECPEGLHFDESESTCSSPEEAQCRIGQAEEEEEPAEEEPAEEEPAEEEPVEEETTTTIATTTVAITTTESTTTEVATTTVSAVDVTVTESVSAGPPNVVSGAVMQVRDTCPASDKPNEVVLVASTELCSEYYLCQNGQAIEMHCTNRLHFNTETGMCDFADNVGCTLERPTATQCRPNMTDFFPHPENCNYFFYCIKGFLTLQQCPFFYGWDTDRRSCVLMSQAKCFKSSKRQNLRKY